MNSNILKEAYQEYVGWMLPSKKELKEMGLATAYIIFVYLLFWITSLFL